MMENLKDIEKEIDKITEVSGFEDPLQLLSSSKMKNNVSTAMKQLTSFVSEMYDQLSLLKEKVHRLAKKANYEDNEGLRIGIEKFGELFKGDNVKLYYVEEEKTKKEFVAEYKVSEAVFNVVDGDDTFVYLLNSDDEKNGEPVKVNKEFAFFLNGDKPYNYYYLDKDSAYTLRAELMNGKFSM